MLAGTADNAVRYMLADSYWYTLASYVGIMVAVLVFVVASAIVWVNVIKIPLVCRLWDMVYGMTGMPRFWT